jgi:O-antigen/teichoic acid export membrane protein
MTIAFIKFKRLKLIAVGGLSKLIVSLSSVITSFVIIRWHSANLWGEVVGYILFLDFSFSIIAWGATPFLIRQFSFHPKKSKASWVEAFWSRIPLLILVAIALLFFPFSIESKIILMLWAIARYIYHSFESLVQFERKFVFSLVVESLGLAIILIPIFLMPAPFEAIYVILLFTLSMIFRALVSSIFFRSFWAFQWPQKKYYVIAFPFLLLTFTAMLQQRTDLYLVAYYLPKNETAHYQVFINLVIFAQFLGSLLLSPFASTIFRLPQKSLTKLERRFILLGIPLSAISILGIFIIIKLFYLIDLSIYLYLLGFFYIFAFYSYLIKNYELGKSLQQTKVSAFSFAASVINILVSILLTPLFHLEGALLAGLAGQLMLILLYHYNPTGIHATR